MSVFHANLLKHILGNRKKMHTSVKAQVADTNKLF